MPHRSVREVPSPLIRGNRGSQDVLKPVAQIITSTSWWVPEASKNPVASILPISSVKTVELGATRASR